MSAQPPATLDIARRLVVEELVRLELAKLTPRARRRLRMQMEDDERRRRHKAVSR